MPENTLNIALNNTTKSIHLRDFYENAVCDIKINRPHNLFFPDAWTHAFAQGLQNIATETLGFGNSTILEVGVGIGINMAGLLSMRDPPVDFVGTDICEDAIAASSLLAHKEGWDITLLQSDLLNDVPNQVLAKVNYIFACIPQVPASSKMNLKDDDNFAHYYEPTGTKWDKFGLGLNAALLQQTAERAPHAFVVLNLSGRPGLKRLKSLFTHHGYKAPIICYQTMVEQHHETSLAAFATMEQNGSEPFEFFEDEEGQIPTCATVAEQRRLVGKKVYHRIYVLIAPPIL